MSRKPKSRNPGGLFNLVLIAVVCFGLTTTFASAKNVLLITIDSCRADRFGTYGHEGRNTPVIDAWAKTGTLFENAYSTSAWTAPGLVSILTGLYPPAHGVNNRDHSGFDAVPTLPEILKQRGYRVPNLNFFTFAAYYTKLGLPPVARQYFGEQPGEELINWLEENARADSSAPFFVWYHNTMVHQPYNPPAEELPAPLDELQKRPAIRAVMNGAIVPVGSTRFEEGDEKVLNQLYQLEISRVDRFFRKVLELLEKRGLLNDTLIVLTADHGEELLDHGFVGHASTSLQAKLYEEIVRIPLIVSWPGRVPAGRRVKEMVSQIDVLPTLLNLLGIEPPALLHGRDLLGPQPPRPLFFESVISGNQTTKEHEGIWLRAIRQGDHKFISSEELYDLKSDPAEQINLAEQKPELTARLRSALKQWLRETLADRPSPDPTEVLLPLSTQACPSVFTPENGTTLDYDLHTGAILLDWTGHRNVRYLVQYDIGTGDHHISGVFEVQGNHQLLGPIHPELWTNLKAWNPFKIRVSPRQAKPCWSDWVRFEF